MTDAEIKTAIRSELPFFAVTTQGDFLARYVWLGPVFRWQWNQMIPTPLQSDDLCWWLQAAAEEGHSIAANNRATPPEDA